MRLNLEILDRSNVKVSELSAIGGGAKNHKLVQLKSNVLGKSISITKVIEAGCLGAAMLAKRALSKRSLADIASEWVEVSEYIEPKDVAKVRYDEIFNTYMDFYETIKTFQLRRQVK